MQNCSQSTHYPDQTSASIGVVSNNMAMEHEQNLVMQLTICWTCTWKQMHLYCLQKLEVW
jgi:hypothetical protein